MVYGSCLYACSSVVSIYLLSHATWWQCWDRPTVVKIAVDLHHSPLFKLHIIAAVFSAVYTVGINCRKHIFRTHTTDNNNKKRDLGSPICLWQFLITIIYSCILIHSPIFNNDHDDNQAPTLRLSAIYQIRNIKMNKQFITKVSSVCCFSLVHACTNQAYK